MISQKIAVTAPGHRGAKERKSGPHADLDSQPTSEIVSAAGKASERRPTSELHVGKRVGRYVIDRLLGEGGMATVWRAVHEQLGGEVAIKILAPDAIRGVQELERFFQEARVSAQLNHDHVVKVIDYAHESEVGSYIVMELLHGRGLDRVLAAEGPLDEDRSISIALQIADALAAAHASGIVHRDLKPANVFVTRTLGTEIVKVMDFGIAKIPMSRAVALTRPGEIYGTPLYMSPEQWDNADIGFASDIYSLGVVLYEMLSGKRPFNGSAVTELVKNVALHEAVPITAHRPMVSPALAAIVHRCLRKRPEERFASMGDLRAALELARKDRNHVAAPSFPTQSLTQSLRQSVRPISSIPPPLTQSLDLQVAGLPSKKKRRSSALWPILSAALTAMLVVAVAGFATGRWSHLWSMSGLVANTAPPAATQTPPPPAPTPTHALDPIPEPAPPATIAAAAAKSAPTSRSSAVAPRVSTSPRTRPPPPSSAKPVRNTAPAKAAAPRDEDDLLHKQ